MPSTPTTKSQVQAYRFVLRRMQSALVRKDAVMLHDPMRTHSRATVVGVCLAAVGVIGFLIYGLISPAPTPPDEDGIIVAEPSGAVYVLLTKTERGKVLVPTFNLASARLLMLSRGQGQGNQQASQTEQGNGAQELKTPKVIPDDKLVDIPRERLTGIQDAPQLLPENGSQRVGTSWGVCDEYVLDNSLPNPASENKVETTVISGHPDLGPELTPGESLLVQSPDGQMYLVYRIAESRNFPNEAAVRAKVDMKNSAVRSALRLTEGQVRKITVGFLNAIPEAPPLAAPDIAGQGEAGSHPVEGVKVGQVFKTESAGQDGFTYWVMLRDGIQRIRKSTAEILRFANSVGGEEIKSVRPDRIDDIPQVSEISDESFPELIPEVLEARNRPVACLGWDVRGEGQNLTEFRKVHVGNALPVPKNSQGRPATIEISTPSADGQRIDHFYMPPGRGAVVRGSTSKEDFATGPIYLISDRGVKYGVPDATTARALGLGDQKPAPDAIVRLLPNGASLNTRDVQQSFDSVNGAGTFPSAGAQPGAQGGS